MAASPDRQQDPVPCGLEVVRVRTGTTLRIVVSGEVDLATVPLLRDEIEQAAGRDLDIIVLDFQHVTFMDSSGLHAILEAHEQLNGRLRIMPSPPVSRLFDIAKVRDGLTVITSATPWVSQAPEPPGLTPGFTA